MQLTQQIRISPSSEQEEVLWKLSEKCRLIYNFALAERREAWKNKVKGITYTKQQNDLPTLKEQYPEYKWVYSKVLQYVLRTLDANYRSFFALRKNGHRDVQPPAFKGENYFTSMVYNQSGFKIGKGQISFSHKYNDTPLTFTIPEKFSFEKKQVKQVTIHAKQKKYFVSVTYEEDEKPYVDNDTFQAIDLGVTNIVNAVNSAGKFLVIRNQRSGKYWNSSIAGLQSRRDRCIEYSNRWKHLDGIVRKYQMKCADQTKYFHHKLSRRLVENTKANTIIVGDLKVKKMTRSIKVPKSMRKELNRAMQNTGTMGRFVHFLTYKSKRVGKRTIGIDERNSTKECYICGAIHDMRLWNRIMDCDCGNVIDRDKNGAINIMKRYLSQNALGTGYQEFLGNLRQTAKRKTKVSHMG